MSGSWSSDEDGAHRRDPVKGGEGPANPAEADRIVGWLLERLAPRTAAREDALDAARRRTLLRDVLTTRPAVPLPDEVGPVLDRLWAWEAGRRTTVPAAGLPRWSTTSPGHHLSLWQGDLTSLDVDVVVNAANERMLGCFGPGHACIDNAIHTAAGPWLRAECAEHVARQGHPEPTGSATLTGGYHLPARHVVHTVGPIVTGRRPTAADAQALTRCYRSILDLVQREGLGAVAFCSISTGAFGYPVAEAAPVAVRAVTGWLSDHPEVDLHVVFCTYSDHDTTVYRDTLAAMVGAAGH